MALVLVSLALMLTILIARRAVAAVVFAVAALSAGNAAAQLTGEIIRPLVVETWHGWQPLGGATVSGADCIATQANRIDCFNSVTGGFVTRTQWDGQRWTGPTLMGGFELYNLDSRPDCVTWAADHIDCFARRISDRALFQRTIHGNFMTGWQALAGVLTSDPGCVSVRAERLDCFGRGTDGQFWQNSFDGNIWSGWQPRGGQILQTTNPSCVSFRGEPHCIFVTPSNTLRHFAFTTAGIVSRDMGGGALQTPGTANLGPKCYVSVDPDLNSNQDDQIHCFAPRVGTSSAYLARWGWNGQGNWSISDLGANFSINADWDCVVRNSQRIDCVELILRQPNPGATFRHRRFELGLGVRVADVNMPQAIGGTPNSIRCVSWAADRLDCFATGQNAPLQHAWLTLDQPEILRPARPIPRTPDH